MGRLNLAISSLRSRRTRSRVVGANQTMRRIGDIVDPNNPSGGGFLENVGNFLRPVGSFAGWLLGGIGGVLQFSFTALWGIIVNTTAFIFNFNWNISDKDIDAQFQSIKLRIAGQLGGTVGNLLGFLACGVVPAVGIMSFNEILGYKLLLEVGEEALDEFLGNLRQLLRTILTGAAQGIAYTIFKGTRRAIKSYYKDPNSGQSRAMKDIFGNGFDKAVKGWGEEGSQPWSFNIAIENAIESIKDPLAQEFVEELWDEFLDGCVEAGYVIAGGLDNWFLEQQLAQQTLLGSDRVIEITPDREADEERIIIAGPEQLVRNQATQAMVTHSLLHNRDVGMWVGEQLRYDVLVKPSRISLRIQLYNSQFPPFYRTNDRTTEVQITIPGLTRAKMDWERIKLAAGGVNGYLWGRFQCVAKLKDDDDNYRGDLRIWGGSKAEAEQRLRACLELSEYKIVALSHHEQAREGIRERIREQYKETTRIYPAYCTILNTEKVISEALGQTELSGTYKRKRDRINLYPSSKPDDFEETVNRLFRTPGPNL